MSGTVVNIAVYRASDPSSISVWRKFFFFISYFQFVSFFFQRWKELLDYFINNWTAHNPKQ